MTTEIEYLDEEVEMDPVLEELSETVSTFVDDFDTDDNALLVLGVHYVEGKDEDDMGGVQTFIAATGFNQILGEGLYVELMENIQQGNYGLFTALRSAVRAVEEQLGIEPDEEYGNEHTSKTIH